MSADLLNTERFGGFEKGKYRAPYKNEKRLRIISAAVCAAAEFGVIALMLFVTDEFAKITNSQNSAALFAAIAAAAVLAFGSLLVLALWSTLRMFVEHGVECEFTAYDDKFIASEKGTEHIFFYADVEDAVFTAKSFMGKIYGYEVDIVLKYRTETMGLNFPGGYQPPSSTPFYIIKERAELLKKPVFDRKDDQTDEETEEFFAKRPPKREFAMLEVSPKGISEEAAPKPPAEERPARDDRSAGEIIGRGHFSVPRPRGQEMMIITPAAVFLTLGGFCVVLTANMFFTEVGLFAAFVLGSAAAIFFTLGITTARLALSGNLCEYVADDDYFTVKQKDELILRVKYEDVLAVEYAPMKFLWIMRGYHVKIVMKNNVSVQTDYVFPGNFRKIRERDLPFELIKEKMPTSF